tara:strand:+ start:1352 stop:3226 length:1875 start_codon:yes stop_codon:yes gene_type:complete
MAKENTENIEKLSFQAEVSRLLDIVANSLYSEREIFLRELISNSADACEKLRYLAISDEKLLEKSKNFEIKINLSKKNELITISDNGIGMNKDELIENLGTIARSGTSNFLKKINKDKNKKNNISETIGQFGVGFYSSFMVAQLVQVESKKAGSQDSWIWESDGKNNFKIKKSTKKDKGTSITLKIKKDAKEFLEFFRLSQIITKYSNYITFPIYLNDLDDTKQKEEKINEGDPLWQKDKNKIKEEDYNQFYKNISYNFDNPLKSIHFVAEGMINYKAILFLPSDQPFDLFNPERKNKIKLYVQKIFVSDDCENIIPNWLRFIPGIIDSQDISLNISREMLQNNPIISKIKNGITNKILNEIENLSKKEKNQYDKFWNNFGAIIKEGLYEFNDFQNKLLTLVRFKSTFNDDLISLDDYMKKIKKEQKEIYYFSNFDKNNKNIKKSPQLETFIENNIPVILMTDPVDEFWLQNITKFKDKEFKSITKGSINLDKDNIKNSDKIPNNINNLINILKHELKEKIKDVKISNRLTKSPLILVADESGIDINMEKLMKIQNQNISDNKKILEINPKHLMIIKISESLDKLDHKKLSNLILDNANILDGNLIENPSNYMEMLTEIFIKQN